MSSKASDPAELSLDNGTRIALHHQYLLDATAAQYANQQNALDGAINSTEALLSALGYEVQNAHQSDKGVCLAGSSHTRKTWIEILEDARGTTPEHVDFEMLLSPSEIEGVLSNHAAIGADLSWLNSLDRFDVAVSVASGLIAGVIDVLLVGVPAHPGFLGAKPSEGGWLSNIFKEKSVQLLPADKIKELEKAYRTSYDASTNSSLAENVAGLGPRTHRYQSLGHDPLLGFVFGVRDILTGEFSAISKDGHLIIQQVAEPILEGERLFVRIAEAIQTQFGHLLSDVSTAAGLPAPLMPLLSFLQFGKIGNQSYTIGEVARQMYRSGYDFRHFLASSIPALVAEIIVRICYFIRSIQSGKSFLEAIPNASSVKLRRQLLIAHSTALLVNAGKVYVTQNPLAIGWAQVLVFLRYVGPEVTFLLHGKEAERARLVEEQIMLGYENLSAEALLLLDEAPILMV